MTVRHKYGTLYDSTAALNIYRIEASSNLWNWAPLQTDAAPFTVLDTESTTLPQRFYRALLAP